MRRSYVFLCKKCTWMTAGTCAVKLVQEQHSQARLVREKIAYTYTEQITYILIIAQAIYGCFV
jgi:hypothetical protein